MVSHTQVILTFISTCIEATARTLGLPYSEVFRRMQLIGMIENYIYPNYETLHTESRENIALDMIECMNTWETRNQMCILNQEIIDKHLTYHATEQLL